MNTDFLTQLPIWIIAFVVASSFHEFAHAWMAYRLGDDTAERAGRLTLNPIPHIDPMGIIILIVLLASSGGQFGFGWAKPVPFNPYQLGSPKRDTGLVALAGPVSNIIQAIVIAIIFKLFESQIMAHPGLISFFRIFIFLNIILAGFNLIPIPPLDGSKILFSLLPNSMMGVYATFERFGMIILIVVLVTPLGDYIIPKFIFPILFGLIWLFKLPFELFVS